MIDKSAPHAADTFIDEAPRGITRFVLPVVVGAALGLGVLVGQASATVAPTAGPVSALDAADARTQKLAAVRLTFHETLSAKLPPIPTRAQAAIAEPGAPATDTPSDELAKPAVNEIPTIDAALQKVLGGTAPTKTYALQLGSFPTETAAKQASASLAQAGHKTSVVAADIAGKGTVYRVRLAGFPTKDAAEAYKAKLTSQSLLVSE